MRIIASIFSSVLGMTLMSPGFAKELHLYLGGLKAASYSNTTYSWALEYRSTLSDHMSGSFTWLNEGHVPNHHRDGQAAQIWWHTTQASRGARFEVGIGPYRYFDTVTASNAEGYTNVHGWGLIASAGATWSRGNNWLNSLRINRVKAHNSMSSTAIVASLGYRFGSTSDTVVKTEAMGRSMNSRRSELDAMIGGTVVNSLDADANLATAIAWRVRATAHLTGSLTYLNEGNVQLGRRAGFAAQVWIEDNLTDRFSVGAGLGPYYAVQKPLRSDRSSTPAMSTLISVTASYAITPDWIGRLVWNRVETHYDRDSDVFMFSLGYRL